MYGPRPMSPLLISIALPMSTQEKASDDSSSESQGVPQIAHPPQLQAKDYCDLWRHSQSRADGLKSSMLTSVTWVVGLAVGLLVLAVTKFVDAGGDVRHRWIVAAFCFLGLFLCGYARLILSEFANHIRTNWVQADAFRDKVPELKALLDAVSRKPEPDPQNASLRAWFKLIWVQVGIVVALVACAFLIVLFFVATVGPAQ